MIELKIDGVCKGCIFQQLTLNKWDGKARCIHGMVCKFVSDPNGKEEYIRTIASMRAMQERNADA